MSLAMARIAANDGIKTLACTPHIYPGMYENTADGIHTATVALQQAIAAEGIPLTLTYASDTHVMPDLLQKLADGSVPTFSGGRYFLLEPPHHVAPPNFEGFVFQVLAAGYVPIVTHPERLSWIEQDYEIFCRVAKQGAWMQLTAGSLTGRFGSNARYWGERMLDDGVVHILATDAHGPERRPPLLAEGMHAAAKWVGEAEARHMVTTRPAAVLQNLESAQVPPMLALQNRSSKQGASIFAKIKTLFG